MALLYPLRPPNDEEMYGRDLVDHISTETSGSFQTILLAVMECTDPCVDLDFGAGCDALKEAMDGLAPTRMPSSGFTGKRRELSGCASRSAQTQMRCWCPPRMRSGIWAASSSSWWHVQLKQGERRLPEALRCMLEAEEAKFDLEADTPLFDGVSLSCCIGPLAATPPYQCRRELSISQFVQSGSKAFCRCKHGSIDVVFKSPQPFLQAASCGCRPRGWLSLH